MPTLSVSDYIGLATLMLTLTGGVLGWVNRRDKVQSRRLVTIGRKVNQATKRIGRIDKSMAVQARCHDNFKNDFQKITNRQDRQEEQLRKQGESLARIEVRVNQEDVRP